MQRTSSERTLSVDLLFAVGGSFWDVPPEERWQTTPVTLTKKTPYAVRNLREARRERRHSRVLRGR